MSKLEDLQRIVDKYLRIGRSEECAVAQEIKNVLESSPEELHIGVDKLHGLSGSIPISMKTRLAILHEEINEIYEACAHDGARAYLDVAKTAVNCAKHRFVAKKVD